MRGRRKGLIAPGVVAGIFLAGLFGVTTSALASSDHHTPAYIGECSSLYGWSFNYSTTADRSCPDGSATTDMQDWYKEDATGNTCYVVTHKGICESDEWSSDTATEEESPMLTRELSPEQGESLENTTARQRHRTDMHRRDLAAFNLLAYLMTLSSVKDGYEPSDLPEWKLELSAQGSVSESEMELTSDLGRESDVRSLAFNLKATKDAFHISTQVSYTGLKGTGLNDGQDTDSFGLLVMPSYQVLSYEKNGIDLVLSGFLEIDDNEYDDWSQTRLVPGIGINTAVMTSIGGFSLSDLFSHDRNLNGDTEVTGEKYINFNTMTFSYILPLTQTLLLTTNLDYMLTFDMPDDMEDSSTGIGVSLDYFGWKGYSVGLRYHDTLDGYDDRGITLTIGHNW